MSDRIGPLQIVDRRHRHRAKHAEFLALLVKEMCVEAVLDEMLKRGQGVVAFRMYLEKVLDRLYVAYKVKCDRFKWSKKTFKTFVLMTVEEYLKSLPRFRGFQLGATGV